MYTEYNCSESSDFDLDGAQLGRHVRGSGKPPDITTNVALSFVEGIECHTACISDLSNDNGTSMVPHVRPSMCNNGDQCHWDPGEMIGNPQKLRVLTTICDHSETVSTPELLISSPVIPVWSQASGTCCCIKNYVEKKLKLNDFLPGPHISVQSDLRLGCHLIFQRHHYANDIPVRDPGG